MALGEREASVPLRALRRCWGIGEDTPDGRMLALIAASLDFVPRLRPGDRRPSEVVSGRAGWSVAPEDAAVAAARLRHWLVAALDPDPPAVRPRGGMFPILPNAVLLRQARDSAFVRRLEQGLRLVAQGLLGGTDPAAAGHASSAADLRPVVERLDRVGAEFAYIESLRRQLLARVEALAVRIEHLSPGHRGQTQTLERIQHMMEDACTDLLLRFAQVDRPTADVIAVLRATEPHLARLRRARDALHVLRCAWRPNLDAWDMAADGAEPRGRGGRERPDHGLALLVLRTNRFLAARYLPARPWPVTEDGII